MVQTSARFRPRRRYAFLRGSLVSILIWPAACAVLIALVWTASQAQMTQQKLRLETAQERHAHDVMVDITDHLAAAVAHIDQIALSTRYYFTVLGSKIGLEEQARLGMYSADHGLSLAIFDDHGRPLGSTLQQASLPPSIAHRADFQTHRSNNAAGLLISGPGDHPPQANSGIQFCRRLDDRNGQFAGVVVISIDHAFLQAISGTDNLQKNDFVAVTARDGTVVTASGTGSDAVARLFSTAAQPIAAIGARRFGPEMFADRQPRLVAWQDVPGQPLRMLVGLSDADLLGQFSAIEANERETVLWRGAVLILLSTAGMLVSVRLAWRKFQAAEIRKAYDLAIEGGQEAYYSVRALYDRQGEICDFLIEDCNERGGTFIRHTREQLLGMKFSDLYTGDHAKYVLGIFRRAMEQGFYEDEFRVASASPLVGTWMQRRLVRSGDGLAMTLRDISKSKLQEQALSRMANEDALTALRNRHWLMEFLPAALTKARDTGEKIALLFIDLDEFKAVNDQFGHAAGDELLRTAALRLQSVIRPTDHVVRLGGDEFTIILQQFNDPEEVRTIAQRVLEAFSDPFNLHGGISVVQVSVGISVFPEDGEDAGLLLHHADSAMYSAKQSGKGCYRFYQSPNGAERAGRAA